jgi:hypothetical protein
MKLPNAELLVEPGPNWHGITRIPLPGQAFDGPDAPRETSQLGLKLLDCSHLKKQQAKKSGIES